MEVVIRVAFSALLVAFVGSVPAADVQIVESTIREVRAVPPYDSRPAGTDHFENSYDGGDDGTVGYIKKSEGGGSDGYKHYDTYHKKDGDKYGYEKHTSFGEAKDYVNDAVDAGDKKGKATNNNYQVAEEYNDGGDYFGPSNYFEPADSGHYTADEGPDYGQEGETASYTAAEGESSSEHDEDY